ncbi:MAG: hypothetical protein QM706_09190 [Nitrospira sp.]
MSYRYNTIDVVVGVGMCAILFGALLLFLAVNGTYQAIMPQAPVPEQSAGIESGLRALQPALGQAIVDQVLFERRTNQAMVQSVSEWNRVTLAQHELYSGSLGVLGATLDEAAIIPAAHLARVQNVMGRAIVNVTARGVRSGLLSVDHDGSLYNMRMIDMIETRGQRLHQEFASTWQTLLGRRIVDAAQYDWAQAGAIQERLGWALVRVVEAQRNMEQGQSTQQEQLAGLIFAAVRSETPTGSVVMPVPVASPADGTTIASSEPMAWPEVPISYLLLAVFILSAVFLGALSLVAQSREASALAQIRRDADRWVYRMAA